MLRWNCYEGLPIKVSYATKEIAECNSSHFNFLFTLHLPSMPTTLIQNNENRIFVNLINSGTFANLRIFCYVRGFLLSPPKFNYWNTQITPRTIFQNLNHLYILSFIEKEPLVRHNFNMKEIISRIYVTLSFATLTRTDQILLCFTLSKEWDSSGKKQLYSHTLFCNWKVDWNRCSNFSSPLTRLSVSPTPTEQPQIWFITSSELVIISTKIK